MILRTMASTLPPPPSPKTKPQSSSPPPSQLPLRTIPGSYGLPLLGPLSDRLDYFWFQGPETFFRTRIEKYKSTVFRTNIPPAFPFLGNVNPNIIAVLDVKSFSHLFDMDIVEKKDVLIGDFRPSLSFTGGVRVGVYLDPTDPKHGQVKSFTMDILKRSSEVWVRELLTNLDTFWGTVESDISQNGAASYTFPLQRSFFNFLVAALAGVRPADVSPEISADGYTSLNKWLALQIIPTVKIGILQPLEEIFLHSWAYPFLFVAGDYKKLHDFIENHAGEVIRRGQEDFGLTREETIHNLLFVLGFNAYGGFSVFLPSLIGRIAGDESGLQERIRTEVRRVCGSQSDLNFRSVNEMDLVKSVVYETLRMSPPVPLQFARARKDFRLSSNDSVYEVKKGELLCGYQLLVMRDKTVFDEPEKFKPDRFTGQTGSELLNYLYWSNGPQTGTPSESNKQCAAKDYVTLTASLLVADLFLRYDKIAGNSGQITAVEKAK
ncbi:PREDICTED: linolenate hydroperoxide lyase, chloroplastic [Tarenaya hassleriana]|uniref:linolenate hydroperoxide lyase, chloroplastic n=1 Tax=Tarenaya hassleriana TaxID=28532 RepID=UPI00053C4EA6|nr:PREDICTED: linolenate hydroperoxide lyase, chloroplastic [Tarenaya hassleriana]